MAETTEPPSDAGTSQADAMALAAEAEAAEAEALAAAARARARAARLKREALAMAPAEDENVPEEYADWEDAEDYDDYDDYEAADQEAARSASWRTAVAGAVTKTVHDCHGGRSRHHLRLHRAQRIHCVATP